MISFDRSSKNLHSQEICSSKKRLKFFVGIKAKFLYRAKKKKHSWSGQKISVIEFYGFFQRKPDLNVGIKSESNHMKIIFSSLKLRKKKLTMVVFAL